MHMARKGYCNNDSTQAIQLFIVFLSWHGNLCLEIVIKFSPLF